MNDPISVFSTAITVAKNGLEYINAIKSIKNDAELNTVKIGLQNIILSLQNEIGTVRSSYIMLEKENLELEKKLMDVEDWKTTEEKYSFDDVGNGVIVCVRKESVDTSKWPKWVCANCFKNKKCSPVQTELINDNVHDIYCPDCNFKARIKLKDSEFIPFPDNNPYADNMKDTDLA